ncbi:hypothetical protein GOV11_04930 [Candidatus Woesearchaeota archaeon]|nr:hypothetical protein [Candidatus Woesearchaeota archaeon]
MMIRDKKHVFVFSTSKGDMTIGTDNLSELSQQEWFKSFLGSEQKVQDPNEEIERRANELAQQYVTEYMNKQQQQAPQPQPQAQPQQPRQAQVNFMDVTPDSMTEGMWTSLSLEQQQQYQKKYLQK